VAHAAARLTRARAAEIAARLYETYRDSIDLEKAPKGEPFENLYDLQSLTPTPEHRRLYDELKDELAKLGIPLG
jgi:hypothetical protein